jgi:hypothetical protein
VRSRHRPGTVPGLEPSEVEEIEAEGGNGAEPVEPRA